MAILILVTATGFTLHAHICAGVLQDVAFFEKSDACPMQAQLKPSCHATMQAGADAETEPCCQDHAYQLEQHDETVELSSVKNLKPELKLVALAYTFILPLVQENTAVAAIPEGYQHPPIARDIPILVQSFLL